MGVRWSEIQKMDKVEADTQYLFYRLRRCNETLEAVTLLRKRNPKGRLVSSINCFMSDQSGNLHQERFREYDSDYIWMLNAIANNIPSVEFSDLSADDAKLVKSDLLQSTEGDEDAKTD